MALFPSTKSSGLENDSDSDSSDSSDEDDDDNAIVQTSLIFIKRLWRVTSVTQMVRKSDAVGYTGWRLDITTGTMEHVSQAKPMDDSKEQWYIIPQVFQAERKEELGSVGVSKKRGHDSINLDNVGQGTAPLVIRTPAISSSLSDRRDCLTDKSEIITLVHELLYEVCGIAKTDLPSQERVEEVFSILSGHTCAFYKSLMQKYIRCSPVYSQLRRTDNTMSQWVDSKLGLIVCMICLGRAPGSFVPDIQR